MSVTVKSNNKSDNDETFKTRKLTMLENKMENISGKNQMYQRDMSLAIRGKVNINQSQSGSVPSSNKNFMLRNRNTLVSESGGDTHEIQLINPEKYRLIAKRRIISNWKLVMLLAHVVHCLCEIQTIMPLREVDHTHIYR